MSDDRIFEPSTGFVRKEWHKIQSEKIEMIKDAGIQISDHPASIFSLMNKPSSLQDERVIEEVFNLFESVNKFLSDVKNQLLTPTSTTFGAIHKSFMDSGLVNFVNVVSSAGRVAIYLIFKANVQEDETTKSKIWQIIHDKFPIGTEYDGDKVVTGYSSNKQLMKYKYKLGTKKYVYMSVQYKTVDKEYLIKNVDNEIRKLFQEVVKRNYKQMGLDFEYQDFLTPVSFIQGIKSLKINAMTKDKPDYEINDDTTWQTNEDIPVKDDEVLVFDTSKRLLINVDSDN